VNWPPAIAHAWVSDSRSCHRRDTAPPSPVTMIVPSSPRTTPSRPGNSIKTSGIITFSAIHEECRPTEHWRGGRPGPAGTMIPSPIVVCRRCGHEEPEEPILRRVSPGWRATCLPGGGGRRGSRSAHRTRSRAARSPAYRTDRLHERSSGPPGRGSDAGRLPLTPRSAPGRKTTSRAPCRLSSGMVWRTHPSIRVMSTRGRLVGVYLSGEGAVP
jgi:hypothetical protein